MSRLKQPKTEPEFVAPPNTVKFENSKEGLEGKLAEHYFDFSFYYPKEWTVVPKTPSGASFAKVERRLPPDFTQENFAVGWYDGSKGTFAVMKQVFRNGSRTLVPDWQKRYRNTEKFLKVRLSSIRSTPMSFALSAFPKELRKAIYSCGDA